MNWDALGAMAELAGALSVLGTLIYLAKQIKDNSKLLSTSIYDTAMEGYNNINKWAVSDPEISEIAYRFFAENEQEMTQLERFRADMIFRIYANHIYKVYRLYDRGVLDASEWSGMGQEAKQVYNSTRLVREFMRDNHFFDDLWRAFDELGDQKMSRFD